MTRPEAIAEVRRLMRDAGITVDELRAEMQMQLDLSAPTNEEAQLRQQPGLATQTPA